MESCALSAIAQLLEKQYLGPEIVRVRMALSSPESTSGGFSRSLAALEKAEIYLGAPPSEAIFAEIHGVNDRGTSDVTP